MQYLLVNKYGRIFGRSDTKVELEDTTGSIRSVDANEERMVLCVGGPLGGYGFCAKITRFFELDAGRIRYEAVLGGDGAWYADWVDESTEEYELVVHHRAVARVRADSPRTVLGFVTLRGERTTPQAITETYEKQRAKGIREYGVPLEACALSPEQLADYAMEEVVDAAAYIVEFKRRHLMLVEATGAVWNGQNWEIGRG